MGWSGNTNTYALIKEAGKIVYTDGSTEAVDAKALLSAPEGALSIMWLALLAVSLAVLATHWL